jgi:hypothetical protein
MSLEKFTEQPKKLDFIAFSYAERIADETSLELDILNKTSDSWEIQIQDTVKGDREQRIGPTLADTSLFIAKLTEFLDADYPEHNWNDLVRITMFEGAYRIKFEPR